MGVYLYTDEWLPGENTVAYYPLNSTTQLNDYQGGNTLTKDGTVSFGTYGGVSCCYINIGMLTTPQLTATSASAGITENIRYYEVDVPQNDNGTIMYVTTNNPRGSNTRPNGTIRAKGRPDSKQGIVGYVDDGSSTTTTAYAVSSGQRYNICYTYKGTTLSLYVNGALVGTATKTDSYDTKYYISLSRSVDLNRSIRGYVSEAIYENKVRTATEILNYYNSTKSNYGL